MDRPVALSVTLSVSQNRRNSSLNLAIINLTFNAFVAHLFTSCTFTTGRIAAYSEGPTHPGTYLFPRVARLRTA